LLIFFVMAHRWHGFASQKRGFFVCHPEERGISTSISTKIGDFAGGVSCGDPSFLGMTRLRLLYVEHFSPNITTKYLSSWRRKDHTRSSTKIAASLYGITSVIIPASGWQDCGYFASKIKNPFWSVFLRSKSVSSACHDKEIL